MKTWSILLIPCLTLVSLGRLWATPSSTFWTVCTIDLQAAGTTHLGVDNYWSGVSGSGPSFPTDIGPEFGASLGTQLAAEYGVDYLAGADDPWYFNAKVGYREKVLSPNAPALELGFWNFGTEPGVTNYDIVYVLTGKSLSDGKTRLAAAYYVGNGAALQSSTGEEQNTGFMVGMDHVLVPDKLTLAADYASGKNYVGGGGLGVYYYFNKNSSLLVGPTWFNDREINGGMKWSTQWDFNF